jgi:hypothetical protein
VTQCGKRLLWSQILGIFNFLPCIKRRKNSINARKKQGMKVEWSPNALGSLQTLYTSGRGEERDRVDEKVVKKQRFLLQNPEPIFEFRF